MLPTWETETEGRSPFFSLTVAYIHQCQSSIRSSDSARRASLVRAHTLSARRQIVYSGSTSSAMARKRAFEVLSLTQGGLLYKVTSGEAHRVASTKRA